MHDEEIIALYFARSENAIEATAEKYGSYCRNIAGRILQSREDAEECVNDTYLSAWNAIPPQKPKYFSVFLGRITRNLSLNRLKYLNAEKRGAQQVTLALSELEECISSGNCVEQSLEEKALVKAIEDFLRAQSVTHRKLFVLRYWHLLPIHEAAKRCAMSQSKAASILFRLRGKLKTFLQKEGIFL